MNHKLEKAIQKFEELQDYWNYEKRHTGTNSLRGLSNRINQINVSDSIRFKIFVCLTNQDRKITSDEIIEFITKEYEENEKFYNKRQNEKAHEVENEKNKSKGLFSYFNNR